ncbi:hypothetical protein J3R82DRAFT_3060 [Butyriboletus roseoflavus]|nr:hypothetical protein J3R82DRAFT_3060 [Butyriboletus roseoflavus]
MSPATTYREQSSISNGPSNGSMTGRPPPARLWLHSVDLTTWDDGDWADPIFSETHPDELDDPWPYRFKESARSLGCLNPLKLCLPEQGYCMGLCQ